MLDNAHKVKDKCSLLLHGKFDPERGGPRAVGTRRRPCAAGCDRGSWFVPLSYGLERKLYQLDRESGLGGGTEGAHAMRVPPASTVVVELDIRAAALSVGRNSRVRCCSLAYG